MRDRIALIEGSILDAAALDRAIAGCEVILHQAAIPSVARSVANPRATNEANVDRNDRGDARGSPAPRPASRVRGSSSVYGIPERCRAARPCDPTRDPRTGRARSPASTTSIRSVSSHGIETVVLRYFNVFGPGQDPDSEYAAVVPRFATAVLEGRRPTINGDGDDLAGLHVRRQRRPANLLASRRTGPRHDLQYRLRRRDTACWISSGVAPRPGGRWNRSSDRPAPAISAIRWPTSRSRASAWVRGRRAVPGRDRADRRLVPRPGPRRDRGRRRVGIEPHLSLTARTALVGTAAGSRTASSTPGMNQVGRVLAALPQGDFFRGVVTIAGATGAAQLIGILSSPIITRLYSPSDYGAFAVAGAGADAARVDRLPPLRAGDPAAQASMWMRPTCSSCAWR